MKHRAQFQQKYLWSTFFLIYEQTFEVAERYRVGTLECGKGGLCKIESIFCPYSISVSRLLLSTVKCAGSAVRCELLAQQNRAQFSSFWTTNASLTLFAHWRSSQFRLDYCLSAETCDTRKILVRLLLKIFSPALFTAVHSRRYLSRLRSLLCLHASSCLFGSLFHASFPPTFGPNFPAIFFHERTPYLLLYFYHSPCHFALTHFCYSSLSLAQQPYSRVPFSVLLHLFASSAQPLFLLLCTQTRHDLRCSDKSDVQHIQFFQESNYKTVAVHDIFPNLRSVHKALLDRKRTSQVKS